jgi:hypothetical protein
LYVESGEPKRTPRLTRSADRFEQRQHFVGVPHAYQRRRQRALRLRLVRAHVRQVTQKQRRLESDDAEVELLVEEPRDTAAHAGRFRGSVTVLAELDDADIRQEWRQEPQVGVIAIGGQPVNPRGCGSERLDWTCECSERKRRAFQEPPAGVTGHGELYEEPRTNAIPLPVTIS